MSAALAGLAAAVSGWRRRGPWLAAVAPGALLAVVVLNRRLYGFFAHEGGLVFAGACLLLHWLYYLYSVRRTRGLGERPARAGAFERRGADVSAAARADGRVRTGAAGSVSEGEG